MHYKILVFIFCLPIIGLSQSTVQQQAFDSLKQQVLLMQAEVDHVQVNLHESHQKFKVGILAATIGYTVTIAGGLMLGRENDKLGQAFLVAGGITGLSGTFLMVDAFKYLDRPYRRSQVSKRP